MTTFKRLLLAGAIVAVPAHGMYVNLSEGRAPFDGGPQAPRSASQETRDLAHPVSWAPWFDDLDALYDCEQEVKRQLIAPSTMDVAWGWRILEHPEQQRVSVWRKFDAQNVYGANLAHYYRCLIDVSTVNACSRSPSGKDSCDG